MANDNRRDLSILGKLADLANSILAKRDTNDKISKRLAKGVSNYTNNNSTLEMKTGNYKYYKNECLVLYRSEGGSFRFGGARVAIVVCLSLISTVVRCRVAGMGAFLRVFLSS